MADGRGKTGCVRATKGINYFLHIIVGGQLGQPTIILYLCERFVKAEYG